MIRSRLHRVLLSAAVLAGALGALNAPAAQAHYSECPKGHFCVWQNNGYEGRFFSSPHDVPNIGSYMNDRTTSVWNRTDHTVCMYRDQNYGYPMGCYGSGGSVSALPIHNDELTSFKRA
ncbi:peptidase inhibitor family I36 protein [Streptomyces carminius]|uniref:peptidase inhibitor family I36 protein n=1 Tax=Streptomyces carminius TaxID=2665496 RepID=UPI001303FC07|nr:peptidase inhibitor family I36 protein [Streptomyces carminius]